MPIEQLVADAISAGNLHLEEAGRADLKTLRQRLQHAVDLVTEALERQTDVKKTSF